MEVVLKYVPRDAGRPAMELKVTLPEKAQRRPLRSLRSVVEKAYAKRHGGVPLDDAVGLYTRAGERLDEAAAVGDAVAAGGAVVLRAARGKRAPAPSVAAVGAEEKAPSVAAAVGKENAAVVERKRKRLVRMNVIADPN